MIRNEDGEPVLIEGIIRDITERRKLENELQESVQRDRELFNSLRKVYINVSLELKGPLRG